MSLRRFNSENTYNMVLDVFNYMFTSIFMLEAVIKIIAMKKKYFDDGWNKFDFAIVLGSIIGILLEHVFKLNNLATISNIVRALRVSRMFKIMKSLKGLKIIFNTLLKTLPSLVNIGGLLFLLVFIFNVLGVQLFSRVIWQDE